MTTALICPTDNLLGMLSNDGTLVTLHAPSESESILVPLQAARSRFPDSTLLAVSDLDDAFKKLAGARERSTSLDFALMLFDADLSETCRQAVATELAELFNDPNNQMYVMDVLLAAPIPVSADVKAARKTTKNVPVVAAFIERLVDAQDRARFAQNAWLGLSSHPMVREEDRDSLRGAFVRIGIFRRLVLEAKTQIEADKVLSNLVIEARNECDPRILQAFTANYKEHLPKGIAKKKPKIVERESVNRESPLPRSSARGVPRLTNADDLTDWATGQVNTIADHFRRGNDELGRQFASEFIAVQASGTSDYSHVVKSLCNLSKQCSISGRQDLCLGFLAKAFEFGSGVDSVAFGQLADEYYRMGQLDRAESCYMQSIEIESDVLRIRELRRKLVRVAAKRGNYPIALSEFNTMIAELPVTPQFREERAALLTEKGTILRRMGSLYDADKSYRGALALDLRRHQPYAGLAETRKQTGRLHKAIRDYNTILSKSDSLDQQSEKVYLLSKSNLLRLTYQYGASRRILEAIHKRYPCDPQIKFQLGTLLTLDGDVSRGSRLISDARKSNGIGDLADELFASAMDIAANAHTSTFQSKKIDEYMPEERGLASCRFALDAIARNSPEEALGLTRMAQHVNSLHSDFGWTLSFHAQKQIDRNYDYKSVQPLARIAKRGSQFLKNAVQAIANEDFDVAFELEKRTCLLFAV